MIPYSDLIARKKAAFAPRGFKVPQLNAALKPHQEHATTFAIEQGCSALFLDTGLGKTFCEEEWGRAVVERTNKPVLMLAPLAVGAQHQAEAERWSIDAAYIRDPAQMTGPRVYITNYERLHLFDTDAFAGVILDESSILKSFTGKTTRALIERFKHTPYRLAGTATPAPNDHVELGTHAEFLGVMRREDMLTRWFMHDSMDTGEWRLKRPAVNDFWAWMTSWARAVTKPSDLGYADDGYELPALDIVRHIVDANIEAETAGALFRVPDQSATAIHREKRLTVGARADRIAALAAAEPGEMRVVWCDTDYEADALLARFREIPGAEAVEVRGSMPVDQKEEALTAFSRGQVRTMVTKPSIAGYGLNWQHCARMSFVGLSYSYESFYQALRRCWRFGQARSVRADVVMAETEGPILAAIDRKAREHEEMKVRMTAAMKSAAAPQQITRAYTPNASASLPSWLQGASS